MIYPYSVSKAMSMLEEKGFEAYIVGGCLRNILMGKEPHDWDMTTSALPNETADIFRDQGYQVIETGIKHGTVTVFIDRNPVEITTFRIDGEYTDTRHPDSVTFTESLREDLSRRDFTVNAMAYSEKTGIVDLFEGKKDLEKKLLRAVGEAQKRFAEDGLRILRTFRFSSEYGFGIEKETRKAIINCKSGLIHISRERIYSELCRILMGDFASFAVSELIDCGLMPFIFCGYDDAFAPKPDVLDQLPRRLALRLACFIINFPKEEAEKVLVSLKMSNADRNATKSVFSSFHALKDSPFDDVISARRFIRVFGENGLDALEFAKIVGIDVKGPQKSIKAAMSTDFPKKITDLAIDGGDVISLGAVGRRTGEVLSFLLERVTEDPSLNTHRDLTDLVKKYITEKENERD